jgi:hypothetical protein
LLFEIAARSHGVDEVVCSLYPVECRRECLRLKHIAVDNFGAAGDSRKRLRVASKAANAAALLPQSLQQPAAQITGGAG